MCGIAGWFSVYPRLDGDNIKLSRMVNSISHRGPDGQGTLLRPHAALGHTRLAIIDIDSGKQPMSFQQHIHIVFNGEIYNYQELMKKLVLKGYQFETHSDTEVILAMYKEYDIHAFSHLRGMFALALWDETLNRGILVRDTIGIKPLFYQIKDHESLIFSSEAKAILSHDKNHAEINPESLHLLMNFRYLPGNKTLFSNVYQLDPGAILVWEKDGSTQTKYYEHQSETSNSSSMDFLDDAVKSHLTADVDVAAYLSGGIDSAAIVAISKKYLSSSFNTYTLDIGDDPNELKNARRTAEIFNVSNFSRPPLQSEISLHDLIWHMESPKVNALQVYQLAAMASEHTKVALSGLGGDELFLGYNAHHLMWQAQLVAQHIPQYITKNSSSFGLFLNKSIEKTSWSERTRALKMLGSLNNWPRVYGLLRNLWDIPGMRSQIYGPRMLDEPLIDAFDYIEDQWPNENNPVTAMAQFEWRNKMVNDMLWQEDRCSMAHGLEVRVPFLDSPLAIHIKSLPSEYLMPKGKLKYYLRDLLKDILPSEVLNRKKSGFQVNSPTFFHTHLAQLADKYLNMETINYYGLFNPIFVQKVRSLKPLTKYRWHFFILYLMLTTHIWLSLFEDAPQNGTITGNIN